jgi:hypothetical protein
VILFTPSPSRHHKVLSPWRGRRPTGRDPHHSVGRCGGGGSRLLILRLAFCAAAAGLIQTGAPAQPRGHPPLSPLHSAGLHSRRKGLQICIASLLYCITAFWFASSAGGFVFVNSSSGRGKNAFAHRCWTQSNITRSHQSNAYINTTTPSTTTNTFRIQQSVN